MSMTVDRRSRDRLGIIRGGLARLGRIKVGKVRLGNLLGLVSVLIAAAFIIGIPATVQARSPYLTSWSGTYTASTSDTNASCELCHGGSSGTLNAYGHAIQVQAAGATPSATTYRSIEGQNSDADAGGYTNLQEINANAQPGWKPGATNTLWQTGTNTITTTTATPPTSVTGPLDPAVATPNISVSPTSLAFGNVTVGQTKTLDVTVSNTGTANLTVSSLTITGAEFSTAKTVPFTVLPAGSTTVPVVYAPTNTGLDNGNLAIASNDPDTATLNVGLSGTGQAATVDLDIMGFRAKAKVNLSRFQPFALKLSVKNTGGLPAVGTATIVGRQDGAIVYTATIPGVTDAVGNGRSTYSVSVSDPTAFKVGTVTWIVTLETPGDVDGPGGDTATAQTEFIA